MLLGGQDRRGGKSELENKVEKLDHAKKKKVNVKARKEYVYTRPAQNQVRQKSQHVCGRDP